MGSEETNPISNTSDPLRGTARTLGSISKAAKRKPAITNYVLEEILPTDSEAEKRRKRVRNCRSKKRAEDVDKEARMNELETDNARMEGNIAQLEQELKQFQQIVAADIGCHARYGFQIKHYRPCFINTQILSEKKTVMF